MLPPMVDPVTFAIRRWPVSRPASARARGLKGVRNVLWKNPENLTDKQRIKLEPRLPGAAPPGSVTTPPARACMKGSEEPGVSRTGDFGFLRDVVLFEPCQLDFIGSHISQCRVKPDLVIP